MESPRLPISACFIAADEETDLPEAIRSVAFCEEVVVIVDERSTDRTAQVARETIASGQRIEVRVEAWRGHVEQKNRALELATHDWVLCLDADERVSDDLRRSIHEVLSEPVGAAGFSVARRTRYLGRWIRGGGWYPDRRVRLFRRDLGRWEGRNPHDRVRVDGVVRPLRGDLLHYSFRDVSDHIDKMDSYTRIAAAEMDAAGVGAPRWRMLAHPPVKFLQMYFIRGGFRDGHAGFVIACLGSFYVFLKYARLWERRRVERDARSHGAVKTLDP